MDTKNTQACLVIDFLGGTDKVAKFVGLKKSAVSQWRKRGIPLAWEKYLRSKRPAAFKAPLHPRPPADGLPSA